MEQNKDDPGRLLRRVREQLRLKYRDVEEASQQIATNRGSQEFLIGLSRLADIENKGTLPSMYRLYSLCVIYGLKFDMVLSWFGINLADLPGDAAKVSVRETRPVDFDAPEFSLDQMPLELDLEFDLRKTIYLNPHVRRWGKLSLALLASTNLRLHRYAFIGTDDWFMYPVIPPGSFIQIDESKKRLHPETAVHEYERPIHFIEHRNGYRCGWCAENNGFLVVQPHPASNMQVELFRYPGDADIIGQVIGAAKRLDLAKRHHTRS